MCSVDAHYVAIVGWPYAMCVDAHVGLGVVECGCPSCLCRDCPHVYVADHDSRGHSLAWGHVIVGPLAHLGPHIMWAHVTGPHSGHMGSLALAIVGKHNAGPGIKVKKSL